MHTLFDHSFVDDDLVSSITFAFQVSLAENSFPSLAEINNSFITILYAVLISDSVSFECLKENAKSYL